MCAGKANHGRERALMRMGDGICHSTVHRNYAGGKVGSSAVTHELDRVPAIFGLQMLAAFLFPFFQGFFFFAGRHGFVWSTDGIELPGWMDGLMLQDEGRVQGRVCRRVHAALPNSAPSPNGTT